MRPLPAAPRPSRPPEALPTAPPPARRPRSPRTHHGCGLSLPRGGSGLGAALRSPHGRAAPEAPPVRRAAAASSQAPGPVPGRRARGAPGRWEGPPEGRPVRAAGGTGNGAATGGAAAAPPGASCGSARPAPPAGSGRPAPPTNRSRGCGVPRVRSPPQCAPVRHLEEGRDVSQGGGKVRARRCASPRPCAAARARPALPALQEAGRGGAGLIWPRPLRGLGVLARERGGRCLATRWGQARPRPSARPRASPDAQASARSPAPRAGDSDGRPKVYLRFFQPHFLRFPKSSVAFFCHKRSLKPAA